MGARGSSGRARGRFLGVVRYAAAGLTAVALGTPAVVAGATSADAAPTLLTTSVSVAITPTSPVGYGTSVVISAQLKQNGSGTKTTGTLDFQVNGTDIAGCSSIGLKTGLGKGSCTTKSLPIGNDSIVVYYSGDSNYAPAQSNPVPYVVGQSTPTVQLNAVPASPSAFGTPVTFTATVSGGGLTPTGTVEFEANGTDIAGCSAVALDSAGAAQCATSALPMGTNAIRVVYSGDSNYQSASASSSYVVTKLTPSVQLTASPTTNDPAGGNVTLTAAISGSGGTPTGTVEFQANGTDINGCSAVAVDGTGNAQCQTTALVKGSDSLLAIYSGDNTYSPGSSGLTYVVGLATPAVYLSVAPGTSAGQYVVTAVVDGPAGIPTGTVEFQLGGSDISGCSSQSLDTGGTASCTTSSLTTGSNSLTAIYSGDTVYIGGQTSIVYNAGLANPTVAVSAIPPTGVTAGSSVTLDASVMSSAGTPTGTVEFDSNGSPIAGCGAVALDGTGNASCTTALPVGGNAIEALYSGDSANNPADGALGYSVGQATPVVQLSAAPGLSAGQYVVTATVSGAAATPTGIIEFQLDGTDISGCSSVALDGTGTATCTTSSLVAGSNALTALYSGDTNYVPGQDEITYVTGLANPTVTLTANPPTGSSTGGLVVLQAAVSSSAGTPTGTVEFRSNGVDITGCSAVGLDSNGDATCPTTTLASGVDTLAAIYSGDSSNNPATGDLPYTVGKVTPAVYVNIVPDTSSPGEYDISGVVVGSAGVPSGALEFELGGVPITGCSSVALDLTGLASCTTSLPTGVSTVTAVYLGDVNYTGNSGSATIDTTLGFSAVAVTAAPATGDAFGDSVTLTATVTGAAGTPTGTVDFQSNGVDISGCTAAALDSNGVATCTTTALAIGTDGIEAAYSGDSLNNPANGALAYMVSQAAAQVGLAALPATTDVVGDRVTLTATVSGSDGTPTGTVEFSANGLTISGCAAVALTTAGTADCQTKSLATGTDTLRATYSGDSTYTGASKQVSYGVAKAKPKVNFTSTTRRSGVGGALVRFTVKLSGQAGTPTGHVAFKDGTKLVTGCSRVAVKSGKATCVTETLTLGKHSVNAHYGGSTNYKGGSATHSYTVIQDGYWIAGSNGSARAYGPVATSGSGAAGCKAVAIVSAPDADGYWIVCSNGSIHAHGAAAALTGPATSGVIAAAATPDGKGMWLLSSNGAIHHVGDAKALPVAQKGSSAPVVAIAATLKGNGLWVAHADGSVTRYGEAESLGFTGSQKLNGVICGIVTAPRGQGYGLVAKDGGVFSFGSFIFHGSLAAHPPASPIIGMGLTPLGDGYILVSRNGTIHVFGAAKAQPAHAGSVAQPIVGIAIGD